MARSGFDLVCQTGPRKDLFRYQIQSVYDHVNNLPVAVGDTFIDPRKIDYV